MIIPHDIISLSFLHNIFYFPIVYKILNNLMKKFISFSQINLFQSRDKHIL